MKILAGLLIILATVTVQAERIVPVVFNLTATALVQNTATTINGVKTISPAVSQKITTASTLANLAQAEYYQGHYASPTFPVGAKLVWLNYTDDFSSSHFVVMDSAMNQICDVDDVLTWDAQIDSSVASGQITTGSPALAKSLKESYTAKLSYDDTNAGGGQKLTANFIVQSTLNDVVSADGLTYKETITSKIVSGTGSGVYYGHVLTLTGKGSAAGSAVIAF